MPPANSRYPTSSKPRHLRGELVRRRGSGGRSPADTCTPRRPAAPCRAAGRCGRTRASRRRRSGPRGRVISRIARRPPGRSTRRSSAIAPERSATLRTPKPTVAASKDASANGSASRSPCTHVELRAPCAARARASAPRSRGPSPVAPAFARDDREVARCRTPRRARVSPGSTTARDGRASPALVEPGGHDPIHHVVDGRDPIEHALHAFGRRGVPYVKCHRALSDLPCGLYTQGQLTRPSA